jgi:hypothetical protein
MHERPHIWLLARGEDLVAELVVERLDEPWVRGRVVPRDGFATLQPLFDREQRSAARVHEEPEAWTDAYQELRREVRLIKPDGREVANFLLHIDHRNANWRSSNHWLVDQLRVAAHPITSGSRAWQRLLRTATVALVVLLGLPMTALARRIDHRRSSNWAGYAVTAAAPVRSVVGRWVQPAARCDQGFPTYSAFWVGLGGFKRGSKKLEQIGTETDCTADGHAKTFAWYELVPNAPVPLELRLPVHAGDRLSGRVTIHGDRVLLGIQNLTTQRHFQKTVSFPAPDASSAEWIAEAPSGCDDAGNCQPLPLTDFGTVHFTNSTATIAGGRPRIITDPAFAVTELILSSSAPLIGPQQAAVPAPASGAAIPTALSGRGAAFAVDFKPGTSPPTRPPPFAAPDQLRHAPPTAHGFDP